MRTLGLCLLSFVLSLTTATLTAAEMKPVLIVTVSSVDGLLSDVAYLAEATGNEQYGQMAGAIAQGYIQGLDNSRPIAIVVQTDGQEVKPLGMLPIKDLDEFLAGLTQQLGEPQDAGDGVWELAGPAPIFVKEDNGWAYVAQHAEDLENLPDDPTSKMGGMEKKYDVGIRGHVQNIPRMYRDMALEQIKEGVQAQMDMLPDDEQDSELQRRVIENQIRQWEAILNEIDQIQIGWNTDQSDKRLVLDSKIVAVPATRTARQMAGIRDAKTRFGGFYQDQAAASLRSTSRIQQQDIDQALAMMPALREKLMDEIEDSDDLPDNAREIAERLADSMFEMVEATIKQGISDGAASLNFDDDSVSLVAGMRVAEGGKLEESLKEISKLADGDPDFPKMEFNVDQHAGVRFHKVSIPVDEDEDQEVHEVFGDLIELTIGVSQESVYFGLGANALAEVMKSMDASQQDQAVKPAEMYMALGPIMKFASQFSDEPVTAAIADELVSSGTGDRVLMSVDPIENGATYHFEIREGILRAIGSGIKAKQAAEMGAGG